MGICITAKNSSYEFDMSYSSFFVLRKNIALALDEKFGENYALLSICRKEKDFAENDKVANSIIAEKNLDEDIIKFLYMSDCEGSIPYTTCKKIYDLIKNIDFSGKYFRYAMCRHNDYEEFKEFLKECYSYRRKMVWE